MNFYEIHDPYYALIRAKDDVDATNEYIEVVAGEDEEFDKIHEDLTYISKSEVEKKLNRIVSEPVEELMDEDLIEEQVRRWLEEKHNEVILIDGSLM